MCKQYDSVKREGAYVRDASNSRVQSCVQPRHLICHYAKFPLFWLTWRKVKCHKMVLSEVSGQGWLLTSRTCSILFSLGQVGTYVSLIAFS